MKKLINLFPGKKGQETPGMIRRVVGERNPISGDKGTLFLILAFGIFIFDLMEAYGRYAGFQWVWGNDFISITINIVTSSLFGLFMLGFLISKVAKKNWRTLGYESVSFGIFAIVTIFFIMNNAWAASPKALIHFGFILFFGFFFIRTHDEASTAYFYMAGLLLIDFFGYGLLSNLVILRYIPFLFLFIIFYIYGKTENNLAIWAFILVLIILFIFAYKDVQTQEGSFQFIAENSGPTLEQTKDDFLDAIDNIVGSWQINLQRQIQYAISGKVEQNQYEPLGVYLEDVRAAETKFYSNEKVIIWGIVKARTLDDIINLKVGCYKKKFGLKIQADKVDPENTFSIYTLEDQDFVCEFDENNQWLGVGSHTITSFVEFNFDTLAYVKTYFMDRERLRAMTRENLDPFDEFGIKDKRPAAIYTNGPVGIDLFTSTAIIGISEQSLTFPRLNINLVNRPGWEGRINSINELVILLPTGIEIKKPESDCTRPFKKYSRSDCTASCKTFVEDPCIEVCQQLEPTFIADCTNLCEQNTALKCEPECTDLFRSDDSSDEYIGYALDVEKINALRNNELKEIERFRSFSCRLDPNAREVLGNTPITTRFFRAKARYNYTVEKDISITIDKIPGAIDRERVGGATTQLSGEFNESLRTVAQALGIDPFLALGLAYQESRFVHCKDGSNDCGTFIQTNVNCDDATNCGLLQINKQQHCPWFFPEIFTASGVPPIPVSNYNCKNSNGDDYDIANLGDDRRIWTAASCDPGTTAFDLNCNIKLGLNLLNDYYNTYVSDFATYSTSVDNTCRVTDYNTLYKSYGGYDRALRAYNGFGCIPDPQVGADVAYIENVKDKAEKIRNEEILIPNK